MASERYLRIWDKELGKTLRAHRVAAEEALGRSLGPGEVVHRVNGDRSDNRAENLQVLPSQAHHMALEQLQRQLKRGVQPLFSEDELIQKQRVYAAGIPATYLSIRRLYVQKSDV